MEIDKTLRRAARNYAIECANLDCIGSRATNPDAWQELFIQHFNAVVLEAPRPSPEWIERWAFVYSGETM